MAIEAGAKNGIFPVDDVTLDYLKSRSEREPIVFEASSDAEYEKTIDIDLNKIVSAVASPHTAASALTGYITEYKEV